MSKTVLFLALLLAATPVQAQLVRLSKEATVEAKQEVRLGDVATVSGTDRHTAEALANTVILSGMETSRTLRAESILLALMSQRGPQNLANLQLAGSAQCTINVAGGKPAAGASTPNPLTPALPPPPPTAAAVRPSQPTLASSATASGEPTAVLTAAVTPVAAEGTLQRLIEARVAQEAAANNDKLRVSFESLAPQLTMPVAGGRKWVCRPLSRTFLGTVMFEAQLTEGVRVLDKLNVQTKIERFQQVVISMAKLDRGDVITADSVRVEETWLDRNLPTLVTSDKDVLGLETTKALAVGTLLDSRDFRAALMASKGDAVTVMYVSGALKVQMRGRAMEEGKMHESITVRNEQTGATYQATLIGKRLAVVGGTLTETEEQKLRENP